MSLFWLKRMLKSTFCPARSAPRRRRFVPGVECLGERSLPAVTASFSPGAGVLTVFGDRLDNNIVVSNDGAGNILINGGNIAISGGVPTVVNTTLIQVYGQAGNDQISLNESNGVLPAAALYGGSGNDTLTGGSGNDLLYGDAGNDFLLGKGGVDQLFGGSGNDTLTGGAGTDSAFGEAGNDRMIWNPGDGTDVNEGGDGNDTVEVNGGNVAETFTISANGSRVRFDRTDPAPFSIDIGTSENLVLNAAGGDDSITAGVGLAPLISLTLNGGTDNDRIVGGDGDDTIIGGPGADEIFMGAGNDTFIWNAGDGSDIVNGEGGNDTLQFNGAAGDESFDLSANGNRLQLFRNLGNITMDVAGVEQVDLTPLGGADTITVGNLTGTDVTNVNIDLGSDGSADTVIVNGTDKADAISIAGSARGVDVLGLAAAIHISGAEAANDHLIVNAQEGNDVIDASRLRSGAIQLTEDGGHGNDLLIGGAGGDTLLGGDGDDVLIGRHGLDVLDGGAGDNIVIQ